MGRHTTRHTAAPPLTRVRLLRARHGQQLADVLLDCERQIHGQVHRRSQQGLQVKALGNVLQRWVGSRHQRQFSGRAAAQCCCGV